MKTKTEQSKKMIIVEAARTIFSKFGFIKTTIEDIAKSARMGKASLYYYFNNKEDIFREVIKKESLIIYNKTTEAIKNVKTPQEKIKIYILTRMKYIHQLGNIYAAITDEFLRNYDFIEKARENFLNEEKELIKTILDEGVKKKIFFIKDTEKIAGIITTALKGLEYPWTINKSEQNLEENLNEMLDIMMKGIEKR